MSLSQSAVAAEPSSAVSSATVDVPVSAAPESRVNESAAASASENKPEAAESTAAVAPDEAINVTTPVASPTVTQAASVTSENVTATAATLDSVKAAAAARYQATGTPEKVIAVDDTVTAMPEVTLLMKTSDGKILETETSTMLQPDTINFPETLTVTQEMIDQLQAAGITTEATPSRYQYQGARINNGVLQTESFVKIPVNLTTDATGATVAAPVTLEVVYDPIALAVDHVYTDGSDATGTDHDVRQIVMTVNDDVVDAATGQRMGSAMNTLTIDFNTDGTAQVRTDGVMLTDLATLKNDLTALNITNDDVNAAITELAQALKDKRLPLLSRKTIQQALTVTGIGMDGVVDTTNENLSPNLTNVQYIYDLAAPAAPVTDANAGLPDKVIDIYHQFDDVIAENAPKDGADETTAPTTTETPVTTPETDPTNTTNQQADVTLTNNVLENGVITPIRIETGTGILSGSQTYTQDTTIQLPASFTISGKTYQFVGYTLVDDGTVIDPATLNPETDVAIKATTAQPVLNTDGTAVTDQYGQPVIAGTTTVIQSVYQVITPSIAVDYVYDDAAQTPLLTQKVTQTQASLPNLGTGQLQKIVLTPSAVAQQNGAPTTLTLVFNSDFTVTHLILNAGTDAETTLPVAYETVGGVVQNEVGASQVQAVLNDLAAGGIDESSPNAGLYQGFLTHLSATGIELNGDVTLPNLDTYNQLSKITYVYTAPTQQQAVVQVIDENNNRVLETKTFTGYPGFTVDTDIAALVAKYQAAGRAVLVNDVPTTLTFDNDAELAQTYVLRVANEVALTVNWVDAATGAPVSIGANGSSWSTSGVLGTTVDLNAQLIALENESGNLYRIVPDYIAENGTTVALTGDTLTLDVPVETATTNVSTLPLMVLDNRGNLPLTSINYQTLLNDPTKALEWMQDLTAGVGDTTDQKDSEAKIINLFLNMYAPNVQGILASTNLSEAERIAIYDNIQQKLAPLVLKEGIKILPVVGSLQQTLEMAYAAGIDEIDWGNTTQYSSEIAAQIEKTKSLIQPTIAEVIGDVLPSMYDIATDVETQLGLPAGVLVDNLQYTTTNSQLANKQIWEFSTANEADLNEQNEGYMLNGVPLIFEVTPFDQATLSLVGGDNVPYILRVNLGRVNVQVNVSNQNGQQLQPITTIGTAYDNDNTLTIPEIDGYTFAKATSSDYQLTTANGQVTFVAPTDGNIQLVYQQNSVAYTIVPTVNSQTLLGYEKGIAGSDVPGSTIKLPVISGYTTTATPTVPTAGGTITVPYTPNEVTADVTIPSNLGPQTVPGVTGKTGEIVDVTVPAVAGYTPDQNAVPATVNPDGTITTDQTVVYTPNEVTANVTIPSNLEPQIVPGVTGKTGETVDVTVPTVAGYTPDQNAVPATVNPDGTITTDQTVVYTPNEVTADVTIPSNLGPQTAPGVTGKTGETVDVTVPTAAGYTPDQTTVPATVNPDGTITTTQQVTYTPNSVAPDQDHNAKGTPELDQSGQTVPVQPQTETTGTTQSEITPAVATQTATNTAQTTVRTNTGTPNLAPALTAREQALATTGTGKLPTPQAATTLPQTNATNSAWLAAVGLALVGFAGFLVAFKPRRPQA